MRIVYRPAIATYFVCMLPEREGERFTIEIDEDAGEVIAQHTTGFRRRLGLTVNTTKTIARKQGWRRVPTGSGTPAGSQAGSPPETPPRQR